MAKAPSKTAAKVSAKTSASSTAKQSSSGKSKGSSTAIDKVCEGILDKLRNLGIDQQLQNDIEWCLGSYRADGNPVGLYAMIERAITVLQDEKSKKTKGVTAKTISDLEKVLASRS